MADVAAMDVVIGAKIEAATAGLNKVQAELAQTAIAGAKVDSAFVRMSKSTQGASQALTNMGRIVQDAPFGFIGISNNLNPMLESFQRLQEESGSTGDALKAMAEELAGPAGIGIAVSVVSSLLVVFGDKLFATSKAVDEANKANVDFNKSLDQSRATGLSTGIQLQALLDIVRDSTLPMKQRNEAADDFNKILGKHGEKLTIANAGTAEMTKQVNNLTEAFINQSLATKFADRIADLMIKQTDQFIAQTEALKNFNKATALAKLQTDPTGLLSALKVEASAAERLSKAEDIVNATSTAIKDLNSNLTDATKTTTALFGAMGTHTDKEEKQAQAIKDTNKALREKIALITAQLPDTKPSIVTPQVPLIGLGDETLKKLLDNQIKAIAELDAKNKERLQKTIDQANQLQDVFSNLFTSIADTGKLSIDSVIKDLERLVIKLAAAAAAAEILNIATGGVAKGGFGFLKIFSGLAIPGHASGGIITSPQIGMIGEAGPEAVIPLSRLNDFIRPAANASPIILETRVSGNDLYLVQSRTARSRNRTY